MSSAAFASEAHPGQAGPGRDAKARVLPGRALILRPPEPASRRFDGLEMSHGIVAGVVAVIMGVGFVAGTEAFATKAHPVVVAQAAPPVETQMDVLYRVQGEVRSLKASLDGMRTAAESNRQEDTIRGLKKSVDLLKQDLESVRTASNSAVGQLGAKLDKLDRDPGPKLAEIASRLDKLDRDPSPKLAEVTARIDRIERQVSSPIPTGSLPIETAPAKAPLPPLRIAQAAIVAPAAPATAAPTPAPRADIPAKPEPVAKVDPAPHGEASARVDAPVRQDIAAQRPTTVDGWMLRDVYGGVALVEGRSGGLREVAPGEYVPGVGEIRSIERRGRSWVVVTSRGIIQADNRW